MDQAAPSDQSILSNLRECSQEPNLDSNRRLRAGGHCQKTAALESESLHKTLQILSVTVFEKTLNLGALSIIQSQESKRAICNQLTLLD
jgi:hypothetical protein